MNGRLYRLTPAGGKPNHYTDSYASAVQRLGGDHLFLCSLELGESRTHRYYTVERVA